MLLMKLDAYDTVLDATGGQLSEFVNPKYADGKREWFKKPARLECMMQDIAKSFCEMGFKAGFVVAPAWFCYNPCKNSTNDAIAMAATGIPGAAPVTAESQQYFAVAEMLRLHGVQIPLAKPLACMDDLSAPLCPRIIIHPSVALFFSEILACFPNPSAVSISSRSTLALSGTGTIVIEELTLDGSLYLSATAPEHALIVRPAAAEEEKAAADGKVDHAAGVVVRNGGHTVLLSDNTQQCTYSYLVT